MNINFLGPVLPTDRFVQMAFVEILNIILTANNIMDVNRMLVGRNANPVFRLPVGTFPVVLLGQPFHVVATDGVQLAALFQAAHIQHPFRNAGKP